MKFKNTQNNYVETLSSPGVLTFLFGPLYFAVKGAWAHVFIGIVLALITYGVSWLIYPFFASSIIRRSYLSRGWVEL